MPMPKDLRINHQSIRLCDICTTFEVPQISATSTLSLILNLILNDPRTLKLTCANESDMPRLVLRCGNLRSHA